MSFLFLIDVVGFYIYIYMHVAQLTKEEAKERDEHISSRTYLYIHLWMLSFTSVLNRCCLIFPCRSSSSIFFFFCMPEIQSSGKTLKKREKERLPISFLMSVFVSYLRIVNTYTVFSIISRCISSERTKKTDWWRMCVCARSHTYKKKRRRRKDIHPNREWQH